MGNEGSGKRTTIRTATLAPVGGRSLLVLNGSSVSTRALPASGTLSIGRDPDSDIPIDDASVSRRHARLEIGPPLRIEDLGSANGTRVRDAALAKSAPAIFAAGEIVEIGSVMIIVQESAPARRAQRIWQHGYFVVRLEDEAARAATAAKPFALARIHCALPVPEGIVEEALAAVLREQDVLGVYGPGEFELILGDTSPEAAEEMKAKLAAALSRLGIAITIGIACHPRDAANPHHLFAIACAKVRGIPGPEDGDSRTPIVESRAMIDLYRMVDRIAAGTLSVLIHGETGVGKELVAQAVHARGPRAKKPFQRVNCGAMPDNLLESALFGHERGSFTGAIASQAGLIEVADGGTVFLDEIGELPLLLQQKLLHVVEAGEITRVGSVKAKRVDVRFVSATHRDLEEAVRQKTFREDLYYRLAGVKLEVKPLRERTEEIPSLAKRFLARASKESGRKLSFSKEAIARMVRHDWPGNVRELRNVVERAALLCNGGTIESEDLAVERPGVRVTTAPTQERAGVANLSEAVSDVKRQKVIDALEACGGNQSEAAVQLGVSRRTLSTWLDQLGITRPRKRS